MPSVVTGAFGYIGRYIARHLIRQGEEVKTITTHPDKPNPFGARVRAFPYNFENPRELTNSLRGSSTLYNTYWIRFEYGGSTFAQAVKNTATLYTCAAEAGIRKIVHISVTHASVTSELDYYRGKGFQEEELVACGVPHSIVRPTLVFGAEDILVNNVAWLIRKFPLFPIFGDGTYTLQPVFVADLAALAVQSASSTTSGVLDAAGPEVFSFEEFVRLIAAAVRPDVRLVHVSPRVGIAAGGAIGALLRDVILTSAELKGLMAGLLTSDQPSRATTRFSDWLRNNRERLGTVYSSELGRHFHWVRSV